jgi:hypothetical protein
LWDVKIMADGLASELVAEYVVGSQASVGFCRVGPEADFEGLQYLASLPSGDQKKFEARFVRLAELGSLVNPEHFNHEGSKHSGRWLMITSGAKKDPKDRTRRQTVARAVRIRDQFLFALAAERAISQEVQHDD